MLEKERIVVAGLVEERQRDFALRLVLQVVLHDDAVRRVLAGVEQTLLGMPHPA